MTRSPPRVTTNWHTCSSQKTTFLKLMLTQLISAGQVVLLYHSSELYLPYHGQVHFQPAVPGPWGLPTCRQAVYCPIWTLFDADFEGQGPQPGSNPDTWPIQATSPNPSQWKRWSKQTRATLLVMPLWNMEELIKGYVLVPPFCHRSQSCDSIEVCR